MQFLMPFKKKWDSLMMNSLENFPSWSLTTSTLCQLLKCPDDGCGRLKTCYTDSVPMDPFLSNPQIEELEDFWSLEENEVPYDDESFEQLLDTSYDF